MNLAEQWVEAVCAESDLNFEFVIQEFDDCYDQAYQGLLFYGELVNPLESLYFYLDMVTKWPVNDDSWPTFMATIMVLIDESLNVGFTQTTVATALFTYKH